MVVRRLTLTLPADHVAEAEALLALAGALAVSSADAGAFPILEPVAGSEPLWPTVRVRALFPESIDACRLGRLLAHLAPDCAWDTLDERAWHERLVARPCVRRFGRRLMCATADWAGASGGRTVVRLHMGVGFGTGEHPTTALCLEWLERHRVDAARILDFGCGSGLLAIAAVMLGARFAWATDTEPQALTATRHNAELNGVSASIWTGLPSALPAIAADLVVANIIAGTLIDNAAWIAQRVRPGGRLVLSGILEAQLPAVERAFAPHFSGFDHAARSGWLRLTATARAAGSSMSA